MDAVHDAHGPDGEIPGQTTCGRGLTADEEKLARSRAEHVIVLMLENRSFDHLLGFLDHPNPAEFGGLRTNPPEPIPIDLNDPSAGDVTPTADGEPRLGVDPPHGHVSALMQMHQVGRHSRMDGFATAYGQKLAGKEDVPVIRWDRIWRLTPLLAIVLAAAAYDIARMGVGGGWVDYLPWLVGALVLACAIAALANASKIPGLSRRGNALLVVVPALLLSLAAQGLSHWISGDRGWVGWPVITWCVLALVVQNTRKGFVQRARVPSDRIHEASTRIVRCIAPERAPVLAKLAREFAVCTRWFSSVPGATWPNRNFAHAGTSDESVDIELGLYEDPTIFDRLDEVHQPPPGDAPDPTWRIYYDKVPQVIAFCNLWRRGRVKNWFPLPQLIDDIARYKADTDVTLPMYTFVEPRHMGEGTNSQHPGNNEEYGSDDFERAEALIACIYDALAANSGLFEKTVLLITYDEHGGFYDHVEPPRAVPPDPLRGRRRDLLRNLVSCFAAHKKRTFPFDQLGVRVPTVVVSPWIAPGRVCRCDYDHASIPATVRRLFIPGADPLSNRDRDAQDILHLLVGGQRAVHGPPTDPGLVTASPFVVEAAETARAGSAPLAYGNDEFSAQLLAVEDQMKDVVVAKVLEQRTRMVTVDVIDPVVEEEAVTAIAEAPPMDLFAAAADSTRNGNPVLDDF